MPCRRADSGIWGGVGSPLKGAPDCRHRRRVPRHQPRVADPPYAHRRLRLPSQAPPAPGRHSRLRPLTPAPPADPHVRRVRRLQLPHLQWISSAGLQDWPPMKVPRHCFPPAPVLHRGWESAGQVWVSQTSSCPDLGVDRAEALALWDVRVSAVGGGFWRNVRAFGKRFFYGLWWGSEAPASMVQGALAAVERGFATIMSVFDRISGGVSGVTSGVVMGSGIGGGGATVTISAGMRSA